MKKRLSILIVILILLSSGNVFASDISLDISSYNSEVYMRYDDDQIHEMMNTNVVSINSSIPDSNRSYIYPDIVSSNSKVIYLHINLRDDKGGRVTGIKVSRIEIIQGNTVVARTNDVESYSINGRYYGRNLEIINSFENSNGENLVDVVLYLGSKEVARLNDKIIEVYSEPIVTRVYPYWTGIGNPKIQLSIDLINVSEEKVVDAYLTDDLGNKITKTDKIYDDYFDPEDNYRYVNLNVSFINNEYLKVNNIYNFVVVVDGKKIEIKDYSNDIEIIDEIRINSRREAYMPNLFVNVSGFNLLQNGPYKIVIEQNGKITKELNDIVATFNEDRYREEIKVELIPEYFLEYGSMYNVKIYDPNGKKLMDYDELVPRDDTSQPENDIVNKFEGFKVFDKKVDVEPKKPWRIKFSEAFDVNTINNGNAYVINKRTGLSVKVDYSFESNGTVLVMTPEENFISGETYILIIDKRVKSSAGANLDQPATIEFTVK